MEKVCITGTWTNELGSVLRIDNCSPEGKITGTFKPAKGGASAGKEHCSVGFWHKDKKLISFCVLFDNSIVTWTGNLRPDNTLETAWVMQKTCEWDGRYAGSNFFKRT